MVRVPPTTSCWCRCYSLFSPLGCTQRVRLILFASSWLYGSVVVVARLSFFILRVYMLVRTRQTLPLRIRMRVCASESMYIISISHNWNRRRNSAGRGGGHDSQEWSEVAQLTGLYMPTRCTKSELRFTSCRSSFNAGDMALLLYPYSLPSTPVPERRRETGTHAQA